MDHDADLLPPSERLAALALARAQPSSSSSSSSEPASSHNKPLAALFKDGQGLVDKLEEGGGPPEEEQAVVHKALLLFQDIAHKVQSLGLLSANEEEEDVATADLKYVLVQYYLGLLHSKATTSSGGGGGGGGGGGPRARMAAVEKAKRHYQAFLQHCEQLRVLQGEDKKAWAAERGMEEEEEEDEEEEGGHDNDRRRRAVLPTKVGGGADPATQRALKIERFRREKASKERLRELNYLYEKLRKDVKEEEEGCEGGGGGQRAGELEEVERERTKLWIETCIRKVLDEWGMLRQELQILTMMARQQGSGSEARGPPSTHPPPPTNPKPLTVTHIDKGGPNGKLRIRQEELRGRVFQPGYSLPTVSLEEFAAQEVAEAQEREAKAKAAADAGPQGPRRYTQLEETGEEDDARLVEESAYQDRAWDDWKDANPRGSGNKMGKRF